jgi:asparagine synthetase B (glutamine-hydrolysing)
MDTASRHLEQLLLEAVRRRLHRHRDTSVSILFSGGVDSVVLAALSLLILDPATPLYLINVEFVEQDQQDDDHDEADGGSGGGAAAAASSRAADTLAAQASFEDLVRRYPQHSIRFISEKVHWNDILTHQSHIQSLLAPKTSVMDLNIGAALWFAARAAPTRVVLTGLGADEQMGGYGRHRKAWQRGTLRNELDFDQSRLWERNLGRDDRVLSDHGKEARFPYLDTAVVDFLRAQSLSHICDFSLPPGQGDKRILRLLAERLGCTSASVAVKRAIQFGSRIAHVSDKHRFGSRRKARGEAILVLPPQT